MLSLVETGESEAELVELGKEGNAFSCPGTEFQMMM